MISAIITRAIFSSIIGVIFVIAYNCLCPLDVKSQRKNETAVDTQFRLLGVNLIFFVAGWACGHLIFNFLE